MDKPVTRKDVRAQVRAERRKAQLAREAVERANVSDLTEVKFRQGQLAEVDTWLEAQVARVTESADKRRDRHRVAIGKSLHAMRMRGESMRGIADQTGLTERQIRDFMQRTGGGARDDDAPAPTHDSHEPDAESQAVPNQTDAQALRAAQPELHESSR